MERQEGKAFAINASDTDPDDFNFNKPFHGWSKEVSPRCGLPWVEQDYSGHDLRSPFQMKPSLTICIVADQKEKSPDLKGSSFDQVFPGSLTDYCEDKLMDSPSCKPKNVEVKRNPSKRPQPRVSFQDADGLKSVGSSVTPMSTPGMSAGLSWSTTPEKPSSDDASRLSAGISTSGRSPSRSGRSTPEKSSSVSPASTPGRSAGLSWGSTSQEGSPFRTPKNTLVQRARRTRSFYVEHSDENDNQCGLKKTENRMAARVKGSDGTEKYCKGSDGGEKHGSTKRTRHADVNENHRGLKNETAALGRDSEGVEKHCDANRAEKNMAVSDGCDNSVKRRTRSFYLEHAEGNEKLKKNLMPAGFKDDHGEGDEKLKKNETPTGDKDEHADGNEKLEKNKTSAGVKGSNVCNKDSISKTAKNEARVSRNDYNLPPPDENTCQISNDREDCCKTMCKICDQPFALTKMRFHTLKEHNLQITKYKEIYGPFVIIDVVYHKCEICGKLVLLDSDFLGAHVKNTHKMKESVYYELYMITTNNPAKKFKSSKVEKESKKKNKFDKMLDFEFDFNKIEYDCNLKNCQFCGKLAAIDVNGTEDIVDQQISGQVKDSGDNKLDESIEWDPAEVCSDLVDVSLDNKNTMEIEVHGHVKDLDQDENVEVDENLDPREGELSKYDLMEEKDKSETFSDDDSEYSFDYTVISIETDSDKTDHNTGDDCSKDDMKNSEEITLDSDEFDAPTESDGEN